MTEWLPSSLTLTNMKNSIRAQLWQENKYKMNRLSEEEAHVLDFSLIDTWMYIVAENILIERILTLLKLHYVF